MSSFFLIELSKRFVRPAQRASAFLQDAPAVTQSVVILYRGKAKRRINTESADVTFCRERMSVLNVWGQMLEAPGNRSHESTTCTFCRIIRGEELASVVFEASLSLAFLDHRPLFPGHCLLVLKAHYGTLADLPAPLVGPLSQNAQLLERAIEEGLGPMERSSPSTTSSVKASPTSSQETTST